jgi:DNA invertase Pin-like site-specific DNA recombinase
MKKAVAYYRTSSAANVGDDKDSAARQQAAVTAYAQRNEIAVVAEYYDPGVSGADPVDTREGFSLLLQRITENGVRTILVETANRFARDLMVAEIGWKRLKDMGVELIAVDSPQAFLDDTPTAILIRQILGAVAQFDKALTVAKLRSGRARKKALTGKCEGQKSWAQTSPAAAEMARELRRQGKSLSEISQALYAAGFKAKTGSPLKKTVVSRMVYLHGLQDSATV